MRYNQCCHLLSIKVIRSSYKLRLRMYISSIAGISHFNMTSIIRQTDFRRASASILALHRHPALSSFVWNDTHEQHVWNDY